MRAQGYGHCGVEPDKAMRRARSLGTDHACHLGLFKAASPTVVDGRRKALDIPAPAESEATA